jgi:hypothetical protein
MVAQTEVCHPPKQLHFKEPFLHKSFLRIWIHIKDMFDNMIEPKLFSRNLWNDLTYQSTGTLKFPGLGPPPTCPFIYYYNVKEPVKKRRQRFFPLLLPGRTVVTNFDDQHIGAHVSRFVPVKRSLDGWPDSVNIVFCFCFKIIRN